jgi:hypothetical protein
VDPTGFTYTEAAAVSLWELNGIPVWGTIAYVTIVGGAAVTEYGPQLFQIAERIGDAFQGDGGGSNSSSNNNWDPNKPDISKLKRLPKKIIDKLGGEEYTSQVKENVGKSMSDLFWNPRTGDVYSIPKNGGQPQWVDTISL